MAPATYSGPITLGQSKYANPQQMKVAMAAIRSIATPAVNHPAENTIGTREQIEAVDMGPQNADVQLAVAQGNVLKQEVDKHAARFSGNVSRAMANTQQLLKLIRKSMEKDNAEDLKTVEDLWTELERLFAAANEAKAAIPAFLEKQRNNMSLYHASMMNETIRETQEELNIQHKKVNIQHNLILEHQEAFQDYKEQTTAKLEALEDLKERLSRLTLEKGHFRTEIDKYKQLLETERSSNVEDQHNTNALQKELEALLVSKTQLQTECETLRKALSKLQGEMKAIEQQITDRFTAELQAKTDQLSKETQKTTDLNVVINNLRESETTARMEANKVKLENKTMSNKYKTQSAEHAKAFTKLNEQTKKIDTLTIDVDRVQNENAELKKHLARLPELQKQGAELAQAKVDLLTQVRGLTTELSTTKEDSNRAKTELDLLVEKAKKLDKEVHKLEKENKDLLSKQVETKKVMQELSTFKNENSKLKSTIDELKAKNTAPTTSDLQTFDKDNMALEKKVNDLEEKKISLEAALQEWTDLAKRSYKE